MHEELFGHLRFLYGTDRAREIYPQLDNIITRYREAVTTPAGEGDAYFSERDVVLITYGDMVQAPEERPLQTLDRFLSRTIAGYINTIHLLPFFPYSSDDGFSIIDYCRVDPRLGTWSDIEELGYSFRLMFDAVVNHVSAESRWFKLFLQAEEPYNEYFIVVPPDTELAHVFRPRALPLLSQVQTSEGSRLVWTTFSADQIDLNFANPQVLLEIIEILLFYVAHGAQLIRLDAIAYIWKELETNCIHLPQTHRIVQLMRSVLDLVAPRVALITETNVPHEENISYFGDGYNEAQMVYNFSLPPLTLHAFHRSSAEKLTEWASSLTLPSPRVTFFNFLASHDGIGLTPARGLLAEEEIAEMALRVEALGGYVSYRTDPEGGQSAYELNISYIDALGVPGKDESDDLVARRFLAAQAMMLALRGVPGVYFHSLFGSRSWFAGAQQSGQKRAINRQKLQRAELEGELAESASLRSRVFPTFLELLRRRTSEPAFHPTGEQEVLAVHPEIFAIWRRTVSGDQHVLCLHNVANQAIAMRVDVSSAGSDADTFIDILTGEQFPVAESQLTLTIGPYGVYWLRPY